MTQKDYIAIAQAIRPIYDREEKWARETGQGDAAAIIVQITEAIAEVLSDDNPRFSTTRFLEAALGES